MNNNKFDHVGLADTGIHWKYLPYENRTPQIFHRHFMSQQLDYASAYNHHGILSGAYQHGRTTSLTTGKLFGRKIDSGRERSALGRWSWKIFRGKG